MEFREIMASKSSKLAAGELPLGVRKKEWGWGGGEQPLVEES